MSVCVLTGTLNTLGLLKNLLDYLSDNKSNGMYVGTFLSVSVAQLSSVESARARFFHI